MLDQGKEVVIKKKPGRPRIHPLSETTGQKSKTAKKKPTAADIAINAAKKEVKERKKAAAEEKKVLAAEKKALAAEKKKANTAKKRAVAIDPWYSKKVDLTPWGLQIWGELHSLSGNNAADITKLLGRKIVVDALVKAAIRKLEIIIDNKDSLPEEIEAAALEVKEYQVEQETYNAPLNVIDRDYQKQDSDGKPIPIVAQHFIIAALRDEISNSFADEFLMAKVGDVKGRVGKEHLRKFIKIYPFHLQLFKDPKMTQLFEACDIITEGQQPVMQVKGFSFNEVLWGPIYFMFRMIFHPKGKFPRLADRELVQQVLYQCTFRGLGGRRSANYGQWEIIKGKYIEYKKPFIMIVGNEEGEKEYAGTSGSDEGGESDLRKTA